MTEDDTFRVLSQRPLNEVRDKLRNHIMVEIEEVEEFLKPYGWTVDELMREMKLEILQIIE